MRWRIAVTAAPRDDEDYLPGCVESLRQAGWSHGEVYAEPGTPDTTHWPMLLAAKTLGPWRNFKRALAGIAVTEAEAEAYAVIQDDGLLAVNVRQYLESQLLTQPCVAAGVVSLYTSEHTEREFAHHDGWFHVPHDRLPARAYGAVAVVIHARNVRPLLDWAATRHDTTKTDYLLGLWCKTAGLPYVQHCPSLAQHVGRVSAVRLGRMQPVWTSARHEGRYIADCATLGGRVETCHQMPQDAVYGAVAKGVSEVA